ncbi:MAG: 50S ribosomal protein L18 [Desulfovibrionaceae bacterium]|nr:50S ribosomal protein L18 [Desulfovibrionaceae bacterium]
MKLSKEQARKRRTVRIRKKISGTGLRPRLVVFRSNKHIYAQIVDDVSGVTLVSSSTLALAKGGKAAHANKEGAAEVGKDVAAKAAAKDIAQVVFDRGGYIYHGRVKALAEGAREGGLKF